MSSELKTHNSKLKTWTNFTNFKKMSAVGYEGHIREELFGKIKFKRAALYILITIGTIILLLSYFLLK